MKPILLTLFVGLMVMWACKKSPPKTGYPDNRIYDIWTLSSIYGEEISPAGERPRLEFKKEENGLTGFAGCNNISANTIIDTNTIRFGTIISTKMTCPDQTIEDRFMNFLAQPPIKYVISDGSLILGNATGKLIFKKID